jgi:hypothetical protein
MKKVIIGTLTLVLTIFLAGSSRAWANSGVIDPSNTGQYKAAFFDTGVVSDTTINFGKFTTESQYDITVSDTELRGYAWGSSVGWIVMNCADTTSGCSGTNGNFKVANNGGVLSGYAWGENTGWINFGPFTDTSISTVKIDTTTGNFEGTQGSAGYAWSQNYGWIIFDCGNANTCVNTNWRPTVTAPVSNGGHAIIPSQPQQTPVTPPTTPVTPPAQPQTPPTQQQSQTTPKTQTQNNTTPPSVPTTAPATGPTQPPPASGPTAPAQSQSAGNSSNSSSSSGSATTFSSQLLGISTTLAGASVAVLNAIQTATAMTLTALRTTTGATTATIVTTTGVVTSVAGGIAIAAIANPGSIAELAFLPLRLWTLLLVFLGFKKRNRPWGTVYDSVTKQPIDPAYVVLSDMNGNEVATSITDINGRYGFLVAPGTYKLSAGKTNYTFPSKKLAGSIGDELYTNLYFGETITITQVGEIIAKNIPLDQMNFDWNEFAKKEQHRLSYYRGSEVVISRISTFLFWFGGIIAIVALIASQNIYNWIIIVAYAVMFCVRHYSPQLKPQGSVSDASTGNPLPFAIVRIAGAGAGQEIAHKVTNQLGNYYCLLPNGEYRASIDRKNPDGSYTKIPIANPVSVKKGYLKENFKA